MPGDDDVGRLSRRALAAAAAGVVLGAAAPARAETQAGSVASVRGMAFAEVGRGVRTLIETGAIYLEDLLRTGDDSRLGVTLSNGNRLNLGARAKLKVERATLDGGGAVTIDSGALIFDRPDHSKRGRLTVTSPYAVIAVRGTKFFAGDAKGYGVFCERGEVQVSAGGKRVVLKAGQGVNIPNPGAAPDAPSAWGAGRIAAAIASTT